MKNNNKNRGIEGKKFEEDIRESFIKQNLYFQRLKDSSSSFSNTSQSRFTSTNPSDFISYNVFNNKILYLECKSIQDLRLDFNKIKEHQIKDMYYLYSSFKHIDCFLIINFRKIEETYSLDINTVYNFYYSLNEENKEHKKSFSYEYIKTNGTRITEHKKRTRFNYDLYEFMYNIK